LLCDAEATGQAIGATLGVGFILFIWFIGFVVLFLVWFMTRPKENVMVYGPEGQAVTLSEKDARKRVERGGWSYTPPGAPEEAMLARRSSDDNDGGVMRHSVNAVADRWQRRFTGPWTTRAFGPVRSRHRYRPRIEFVRFWVATQRARHGIRPILRRIIR
jgi:hypothetical protein